MEQFERDLLDREREEQRWLEYVQKYAQCYNCNHFFTDEGFRPGFGMCKIDMENREYYSFEGWTHCQEYDGPMVYSEE